MVIRDKDGDWAICVARWAAYQGRMRIKPAGKNNNLIRFIVQVRKTNPWYAPCFSLVDGDLNSSVNSSVCWNTRHSADNVFN